MGGFEMMIGLSNIFQVKAQALFEGLKFAWAQGFCQVEIESDNSLLDCRHLERIITDNNRMANRIAKEARGEME
ncbi:hypothetical protein Gohar_005103 [Gossypium harknessii]|uniref:RNase H type-1 domain-containing protein n=1 Tax=Gossypium harknessii TaxID=34285 RepID=A0A7J9H8B2_9ROSI|nr:hypothetical protein [Gossypium harknessii]